MLEGCWLQLQAENVPNAGRMRVLFPTTIIRDTHMRRISTRQRDSSAHLLVVRGWMWTILVLGFFGTLATASAEFIKVNFVDKGGNLPEKSWETAFVDPGSTVAFTPRPTQLPEINA